MEKVKKAGSHIWWLETYWPESGFFFISWVTRLGLRCFLVQLGIQKKSSYKYKHLSSFDTSAVSTRYSFLFPLFYLFRDTIIIIIWQKTGVHLILSLGTNKIRSPTSQHIKRWRLAFLYVSFFFFFWLNIIFLWILISIKTKIWIWIFDSSFYRKWFWNWSISTRKSSKRPWRKCLGLKVL